MSKLKKKKLKLLPLLVIKIFLISVLFYLYFNSTQAVEGEFSNEIYLLSVSKGENNSIIGERLIPLSLRIVPGTGDVFVHSNGILETDTQLSLRNSQSTTCTLLSLDCTSYDFYYSFTQDNLVLEGPSAGAAIAILTAKTLLNERIPKDIGITGALSSGGVIGVVGGVPEKITLTEKFGFKKIIVPYLSSYNESIDHDIEIVKSLDLLEALSEFDSQIILTNTKEIEKEQYSLLMKKLSNDLCSRSDYLLEEITVIEDNSTQNLLFIQAETALNSSKLADKRESYYSKGSFCFGANNNLKSIVELQKNHSKKDLELLLNESLLLIEEKHFEVNSEKYKQSIITLNDFYVWLIINDRISESKTFLKNSLNEYQSYNESLNISFPLPGVTLGYAYAQERLLTVKLWEEFIVHQGEKISFSSDTLAQTCNSLYNEIILKSKVLEQYEVTFFEEDLKSFEEKLQKPFFEANCIYTSLELSGRIDTVISSLGVAQNSSDEFANKLFNVAKTRLSLHTEDSFPLIPFIYFDYAEELYIQGDYSSSLLYTNYALSFGNLELYLHKDETRKEMLRNSVREISIHPAFIFALLLILGFLG